MNQIQNQIFSDIDKERQRQDSKFPGQWANANIDPFFKLAVLSEEVGELSQDLLDNDGEETEHLREELIQTASVCVAWLESLNRKGFFMENTYSLDCYCTNCLQDQHADIPKGVKKEKAEVLCVNCGCNSLKFDKLQKSDFKPSIIGSGAPYYVSSGWDMTYPFNK